jgi:formylmethanofuran dehydrogenase subunit E
MLLDGERENARFVTALQVRSRCSRDREDHNSVRSGEPLVQLEMNVQPRFTTLRFCSRCQTYKPRKDFVYVAGSHVCTDCSGSVTRQLQRVAQTKPRRSRSE